MSVPFEQGAGRGAHEAPAAQERDGQDLTDRDGPGSGATTVSEERLATGTEQYEAGTVRARKHVDVETVEQVVPRGVEHADLERTGPLDGDSGQVETLPDGSLSIPVFEEQIVVEKRLVVRERVVLRKHTVYEEHRVEADLKRERLEVETDGDVRVTGDTEGLADDRSGLGDGLGDDRTGVADGRDGRADGRTDGRADGPDRV